MTTLLALIAFSLQPALAEPLRDRCACIEKNNFYDGEGRLVFTQFIWWSDELPHRNVVSEWRLDEGQPRYLVREGNEWRMVLEDSGVLREIRSPSYIETWSQEDHEMIDRERLPKQYRIGLKRAKSIVLPPVTPFVIETPAE